MKKFGIVLTIAYLAGVLNGYLLSWWSSLAASVLLLGLFVFRRNFIGEN